MKNELNDLTGRLETAQTGKMIKINSYNLTNIIIKNDFKNYSKEMRRLKRSLPS